MSKYSELERKAITASEDRFDHEDYLLKTSFREGYESGAYLVVDLVEEQLMNFRLMDEEEKNQKVLELLFKLSHLTTPV